MKMKTRDREKTIRKRKDNGSSPVVSNLLVGINLESLVALTGDILDLGGNIRLK